MNKAQKNIILFYFNKWSLKGGDSSSVNAICQVKINVYFLLTFDRFENHNASHKTNLFDSVNFL